MTRPRGCDIVAGVARCSLRLIGMCVCKSGDADVHRSRVGLSGEDHDMGLRAPIEVCRHRPLSCPECEQAGCGLVDCLEHAFDVVFIEPRRAVAACLSCGAATELDWGISVMADDAR